MKVESIQIWNLVFDSHRFIFYFWWLDELARDNLIGLYYFLLMSF